MKKTKLFHPYVSFSAVLKTAWLLFKGQQLAEGPLVKKFETEFQKKFKIGHAVALNSGTAALELAYELAGIGPGDEVITPVLTCTATNIPLVRRGASLVFADIGYDLNISVEDVEKKITDKTKAIVFVHFGGNNRGLNEILQLGRKYSLKVIEDAAQAIGSPYWGKADYTAVSLQAIKTLTSGDGGFLFAKSCEDYKKAKRLRWFGYDREEKQRLGDTDLFEAGYKAHMNDIAAAIGLGNMANIDKIIRHRNMLIEIYSSYGLQSSSWLSIVLTNHRDVLISKLKDIGVETGLHHYRNDSYTLFGGRRADLPLMDKLEDKYLLVPTHHKVTKKRAHQIGRLCRMYA